MDLCGRSRVKINPCLVACLALPRQSNLAEVSTWEAVHWCSATWPGTRSEAPERSAEMKPESDCSDIMALLTRINGFGFPAAGCPTENWSSTLPCTYLYRFKRCFAWALWMDIMKVLNWTEWSTLRLCEDVWSRHDCRLQCNSEGLRTRIRVAEGWAFWVHLFATLVFLDIKLDRLRSSLRQFRPHVELDIL